jgi:hypothetical protein
MNILWCDDDVIRLNTISLSKIRVKSLARIVATPPGNVLMHYSFLKVKPTGYTKIIYIFYCSSQVFICNSFFYIKIYQITINIIISPYFGIA